MSSQTKMDEFTKEGRKLRPRKTAGTATSEKVDFSSEGRSSYGDRKPYGEHRSNYSGNGEHRSYGDRKPYGEQRSYGDRKPYGERKSYGEGRPNTGRSNFSGGYGENSGEHRSYGDRKPYGEQRNYGDRKPYGERKSYGEGRPNTGRSNFSGGYGENSGEHRNYGESKPYGERRSYGENNGERRSYGDRKPYGKPAGGRSNFSGGYGAGSRYGKPGAGKKQYGGKPAFDKASNEGINRMISRRPVVNDSEYSDADTINTPIQDEIRLNKFIANSGVCSRREADTLIQAGVVTVNGEVVTELGTKVNIHDDDVRFNGERLKGEEKLYIVMNKPKGFVTTASDPHADKTVIDLIKGCSARVYPVGRLDKNTTGVLMLTNDGEIAERLTHPSYDKKKIYQVILDRALDQEDFDRILAGVTLTDGEVAADELEYIDENDKRKLGIEIHSGKNRIVRRIFESLGYNVRNLDRVYFAGLTKKGLKKGEWRYLTEGEVNILKMGAYV